MTHQASDITAPKKSAFYGLLGGVAPKQFKFLRAHFADRNLERDYQSYLINVELPKERLVNYIGIAVYLIFGILDVFTFNQNLTEVLILRWAVCAPVAILLITLTFFEPLKSRFQHVTLCVMIIGSLSVVAMIGLMDPQGGPPYVIGILAIFIFYACMQRMHFPAAAAVFIGVAAAYSLTITVISPKSPEEIASGHFFMIFIALLAVLTTYMQEIRSRINFFQLRQREQDAAFIEELLIEATAADRAKISFLSILSHELRTPLHQIVGFSEVVKNQIAEDPSSNPGEYLDEIHVSATGLLSSIGKMLRYADATAGKISYDITECPVSYLMETIIEQAHTRADGARVMLNVAEFGNTALNIDHLHTAYAIGQLIDNAITASEPGSKIDIRGRMDALDRYVLEIEDNGCGMSEYQINAAFTPFMQIEDVRTRSVEGIGLGLTLSRKILADQNAELVLTSEVGKGTTASVFFPIAGSGAQRPDEAAAG